MAAHSAAAKGNRRVLVIGSIGLGLLLVFYLATHVLGGGGSKSSAEPLPGGPRPAPTPTTMVAPAGPAPAETYQVFSGGKNPFTPLVSDAATSSAGSAASGTTAAVAATATAPATATLAAAPSQPASTAPPPPAAGAPGTEPSAAQRVSVLSIFTDGGPTVSKVRVNDTVYEKLKAGDPFADTYKVVALDTQCGTFLFGDDRFRLCQGEEVLK